MGKQRASILSLTRTTAPQPWLLGCPETLPGEVSSPAELLPDRHTSSTG